MRSSNFAAARLFLERAAEMLQGDDETSQQAREALDLLIEAVVTKEFSRLAKGDNVARFPNGPGRDP